MDGATVAHQNILNYMEEDLQSASFGGCFGAGVLPQCEAQSSKCRPGLSSKHAYASLLLPVVSRVFIYLFMEVKETL